VNRQPHAQTKSCPPRRWFYVNLGLAGTLIIAAIGGLLWANAQTSARRTDSLAARDAQAQGQPAPDFTLQALNGRPVSLSNYRGQVVLVNFWASWCPPCVSELPTLNAFYQAHQAEGFVLLAVNAQEQLDDVQMFVDRNGFKFPVLLDKRAAVMNLYGVRALPVSFILDRRGNIQFVQRGEIDTETLQKVVEPLL